MNTTPDIGYQFLAETLDGNEHNCYAKQYKSKKIATFTESYQNSAIFISNKDAELQLITY